MRLRMKVKVLAGHEATRSEYHDLVCLGNYECRDSLGRESNHGWRIWLVWECNNRDCPARVLVAGEDLSALVTEQAALVIPDALEADA